MVFPLNSFIKWHVQSKEWKARSIGSSDYLIQPKLKLSSLQNEQFVLKAHLSGLHTRNAPDILVFQRRSAMISGPSAHCSIRPIFSDGMAGHLKLYR